MKSLIEVVNVHTACLRMLDESQSVLYIKKRLRLYGKIQAHVEGQLVLHIGRGRDNLACRRTTHANTKIDLEN